MNRSVIPGSTTIAKHSQIKLFYLPFIMYSTLLNVQIILTKKSNKILNKVHIGGLVHYAVTKSCTQLLPFSILT